MLTVSFWVVLFYYRKDSCSLDFRVKKLTDNGAHAGVEISTMTAAGGIVLRVASLPWCCLQHLYWV